MEPDPDWYLDNVIVAGGRERTRIGPVRMRQAAWLTAARTARESAGPLADAIELALTQGFVLSRAQLRELGVAVAVPRRLVRRGEWSAPRWGIVSPLPGHASGPSGIGHEVRATAAALAWTETAVGYASAAQLHGLPLLRPPGAPSVTADHWMRAYAQPDVRVHVAAIRLDEFDEWFGALVTTCARTVVDLARERGVRDGLVAADAALHEQLTTPDELERVLERQRGWPGVRAARRVVEVADGRAESPLESLARLCLVDGGLPVPELQPWIDTSAGSYRVDMLYRERRVIIEVDGMLKYRGDWRVLADEKRRQEALERAGYRVVRLLWDDVVNHPVETVARVRAALRQR